MRDYLLQLNGDDIEMPVAKETVAKETVAKERSFGTFSGCEVYVENETESSIDLQCKYCTYRAGSSSEMRQHLSIHTIESRYKCPVCDKQYKYSGDLHVHLRQDHQLDPDTIQIQKVPIIPNKKSSPAMFRCPCCPYQSHWKAEIDRHSKLHKESKPYKCNNCSYETHWKGDIRRHVFKHHPGIMKEGVVLEDVITVDLDKATRSSEIVVEEQATSDAAIVDLSNMDDVMENSSTSFDDGNSSLERSSMERSRSTTPMKESPGGTQIFQCEYCTFQTNAPSKLSAHIATHVNLKVYMCPVCGRRANWKWDVRKHMKKEHPGSSLDVVKLSRQEAEATIQNYIDTMPVVRREHHLNCDGKTKPDTETPPIQAPPTTAPSAPVNKGKNYVCAECGFKSHLRWNVNRHIKGVHNGRAVDIIFVPDDVNDQEDLERAGIHVPAFSSPQKAPKEESEENMPVSFPITGGKSDKPYMCAECGKRCSIKADVRKHYHYIHPALEIRIMFVDENSITLLPPEDTKSRLSLGPDKPTKMAFSAMDFKPFRCGEPNCDKTANSKGDIKRHYSFMHPGKEVKFICATDVKGDKVKMELMDNLMSGPSVASANPKVFGYIKPFKCAKCGHRSNWKWDLNKHIKAKHPNENPGIITMSEEEARATYTQYQTGPAALQFVREVKVKPVIKEKQVERRKDFVLMRSVFRQFKCSACPYRSNWRSDLMRHIKRKHGIARAKVTVLDVDEAKASLNNYDYKPKKGKGNFGSLKRKYLTKIKGDEKKDSGRIWKCGKCNYRSKDKMSVINHLASHGVKAYKCTVCGYATNYRSSAYRHIKGKHRSDNISLCRVSIKYVKDEQENGDQQEEPSNKKPRLETEQEDIQTQTQTENEEVDFDATEAEMESFIDTYRCTLCNFKANWRSSVCRHIRNAHSTNDYTGLLEGIRRFFNGETKPIDIVCLSSEKKEKPDERTPTMSVSSETEAEDFPDKKYKCNICPYRTSKPNLLKFHISCHTPQPDVIQEKCKFCPYFVVAKRLLHQHMRLHMQDMQQRQKEAAMRGYVTPVKKGSVFRSSSPGSCTPKKYRCTNCPYTSNSKNDFLYHKQFHRQRPSCEYKCDYCDYWVTHKRLIRQHMKIHDNVPSPALSTSVHSSPCKSDITESSVIHDTVQLAMYKQRMISAKIAPSISQKPVVSPMKIACSVGNKPSYAMKNGVYRKMHKCAKCPYMNLRLRNLRLHELMHGNRKSKSGQLLKCPHCDYTVGSKGLLSHHLKVHQPGYMAEMTDMSSGNDDSNNGAFHKKNYGLL